MGDVDGFIPHLKRLSDNSISGQKHVKNKVFKAFKSKKK